MAPEGLYRVKPRVQSWLTPVAGRLARSGISADALTVAAVMVAAGGGAAIALSPGRPALLWLVPLLAALRLLLNVLDGMVARASAATPRRIGEAWNELGDRAADVAFLAGLAAVPEVGPALALAAIVAAVLASHAGVVSRAAGGRRLYGGVMSKPGRMVVLAVAAPLVPLTGTVTPLVVGTVVIALGSLVTLVQRVAVAIRELDNAA